MVFSRRPKLDVVSSANLDERLESIDSWLDVLYQGGYFHGGALVVHNGKPLLRSVYGHQDAAGTTPLTTSSSFRLASVSKQFTAAAVLVLVNRGALGLDDEVADHVEGFPYKAVTVRHLLNQTSGINDSYLRHARRNRDSFGEALSVRDVVDLLAEHEPRPLVEAGTRYRYSNTDYVLLAALVEAVAGTTFEAFTSSALFEPLDMSNTRVWNLLSHEATFETKVADVKVVRGKRRELEPTWIDGVAGDGGVFSSLDDLAKWERIWRKGSLLPNKLLKQAFSPAELADGKKSQYGFGWVLTSRGSWHNGSWLGARTFAAIEPDRKLFVAVLDNASNKGVEKVAARISRAIGQAD